MQVFVCVSTLYFNAIIIITDAPFITVVVSVQFNASTYSVNESGEIVQPVLVLSGSTAINFTVHVNVTDMSATKWSDNKTGDYKSETPLVVSFNEGVSNISVNISIVDDNLLEEDEKFSLTIDSSSLHSNVMVDEPGNTTVTILDDDSKYIGMPYRAQNKNLNLFGHVQKKSPYTYLITP